DFDHAVQAMAQNRPVIIAESKHAGAVGDRVRFLLQSYDVPGTERFGGVIRKLRLGGEDADFVAAVFHSFNEVRGEKAASDRRDDEIQVEVESEHILRQASVPCDNDKDV